MIMILLSNVHLPGLFGTDLEKGIKPILKTNIWVQLYDIFEKAKIWRHLKDQWLPGTQERGRRGTMNR